jgi:predicted aspartyl protease
MEEEPKSTTAAGDEMTDPPRDKREQARWSEGEAERRGGQPSGNERMPAERGGTPAHALSPSTLSIIAEGTRNRLVAQGWTVDKRCSVTIDTGAAVTVVRPDIAAGLPVREPSTKCALQMATGETLPSLREAFVTLTLGRRPLEILVFVVDITDKLILGSVQWDTR